MDRDRLPRAFLKSFRAVFLSILPRSEGGSMEHEERLDRRQRDRIEERRDRRQLDRIEHKIDRVEKHLETMILTMNQIEQDQTAMNRKLDSLSTGTPEQSKQLQEATAKLAESDAKLKSALASVSPK